MSQSGAEDLLPFSLKRGLRNMSVHFMKKLYVFLGVGGESRTVPKTETELVSSISKFVLGQGYNEGAGKQIMLARAGDEKDVDEVVNSPLFQGDYADILEAEVDTTGLKEEIARQAELAERRRVGKAQRQAAIEAAHSCSGPSAAQSAAPRLKPLPSPPTGLTHKEAKELLPPGASVSKTSVWDSQWFIRATSVRSRELSKVAMFCRTMRRSATASQCHGPHTRNRQGRDVHGTWGVPSSMVASIGDVLFFPSSLLAQRQAARRYGSRRVLRQSLPETSVCHSRHSGE